MTKVCPECFGTGAIPVERPPHPPGSRPCRCEIARDIVRNMERAWKGLAKAPKLTESSLIDYPSRDVYITAREATFRSHLRYVAIRQGRNWSFQVSTDADLMTAWLASKALDGMQILDPDAATVSLDKLTLVDLVDPPDLLIVRLGVKSARNSAMPEVLLEALTTREHKGKPTWVWDQPTYPLGPAHLCFSDAVADFLRKWDHVPLDPGGDGGIEMITGTPSGTPPVSLATTLSAAAGASNSGTTRVVEPKPKEPKPKGKPRWSRS